MPLVTSFPLIAGTGLAAGFLHVLSGPDHLTAVAPLALHHPRRAWATGLRWAIGHSSGVLLIALAAWLLRGLLPLERLSSHSERIVGVMLIAIGLWSLHKALRPRLHVHAHEHGGRRHVHMHIHRPGADHAAPAAHVHLHVAVVMGIIHGLAGSSHLLGILPALALPTRAATGVYLGMFCLGTVAAMAGFAAALGLIGQRSVRAAPYLHAGLLYACALAAVGVGGYWLMF